MEQMRRVVTGHTVAGKSIIVSDAMAEGVSISPGKTFIQLWGSDSIPHRPDHGTMNENLDWFPKPGGHRFFLWTVPPKSTSSDKAESKEEIEELLPGFLTHFEPDNPGMHTTDSVDCTYVVAGSITLELDDGIETELHTGDSIIQNGTRHRWHNRSQIPAVLITTCIGSERKQ